MAHTFRDNHRSRTTSGEDANVPLTVVFHHDEDHPRIAVRPVEQMEAAGQRVEERLRQIAAKRSEDRLTVPGVSDALPPTPNAPTRHTRLPATDEWTESKRCGRMRWQRVIRLCGLSLFTGPVAVVLIPLILGPYIAFRLIRWPLMRLGIAPLYRRDWRPLFGGPPNPAQSLPPGDTNWGALQTQGQKGNWQHPSARW
jgi:hypothetical protein